MLKILILKCFSEDMWVLDANNINNKTVKAANFKIFTFKNTIL